MILKMTIKYIFDADKLLLLNNNEKENFANNLNYKVIFKK